MINQQKNVKIAQSTINYQTKESIPDSSQNINGNTSKQSSNPILFHQQNVNVHQQSSSPIFSQQNQKNYNICQNSKKIKLPRLPRPLKRRFSKTQSFQVFYNGTTFIVDPISLSNFSLKFKELIKP